MPGAVLDSLVGTPIVVTPSDSSAGGTTTSNGVGTLIVDGITIPKNGDFVRVGNTNVEQVDVLKNGVKTTVWKKISEPKSVSVEELGKKKVWLSSLKNCTTRNSDMFAAGYTLGPTNNDFWIHIDTGKFDTMGYSKFEMHVTANFSAATELYMYYRVYYGMTNDGDTNPRDSIALYEGNHEYTITDYFSQQYAGIHVFFSGSNNARAEGGYNSLRFKSLTLKN